MKQVRNKVENKRLMKWKQKTLGIWKFSGRTRLSLWWKLTLGGKEKKVKGNGQFWACNRGTNLGIWGEFYVYYRRLVWDTLNATLNIGTHLAFALGPRKPQESFIELVGRKYFPLNGDPVPLVRHSNMRDLRHFL
jgi:hypothetical protein